MAISEKTVKMLWGGAAGRCSAPGCQEDCIPYLDPRGPTVLGEMAHVIAREPSGPRGEADGGTDEYANLILLCPTCHTKVDKTPIGVYPATLLLSWKGAHEKRVHDALAAPLFETRESLFREIGRFLGENRVAWLQFGPESLAANANPLSSLSEIWVLRKMSKIVPNNRRIVNLLAAHPRLLPEEANEAAAFFVEHAEAFEMNCFSRREDVPLFPRAFEELVNEYGRT